MEAGIKVNIQQSRDYIPHIRRHDVQFVVRYQKTTSCTECVANLYIKTMFTKT